MIDPILSAAGGDSQSPHETVPFQDSASEGLKPEPDENILRLVKIMSHDLRTSLFSMLATLKLLNRGYYGKMDEEVAHKIKELLSNATRLTGIQRGVQPITWLQMLLAFHHHWIPSEAYEAFLNIARDHASTHGLEIQYARPDSSQEDTNGRKDKLKERWWERWSMVTGRPLRRSQKRP